MTAQRRKVFPLCLSLALLAGCEFLVPPKAKEVNHYFADQRDLKGVRRIMVLPFHLDEGVEVDEALIRSHFTRELNMIQRFQVEPLPQGAEEDIDINLSLARGRVSVAPLVELANRYKLDGIMVGRITSYRPYLPPHLGMEIKLFSVHSGSWVWAADATYDSSDAKDKEDLEHYASAVMAKEDSMHESRIILLSPAKYATYVSHRLIGTWR